MTGEPSAGADAGISPPLNDVANDPELLVAFSDGLAMQRILAPEQWALAQREHDNFRTGEFAGQILLDRGMIDAERLEYVLARYLRIYQLNLARYEAPPDVLELFRPEEAWAWRAIPIDSMPGILGIAVDNPFHMTMFLRLRERFQRLMRPVYCPRDMLSEYLRLYYPALAPGGAS